MSTLPAAPVEETRIRFEDLASAFESRGVFEMNLGDGCDVIADVIAILVFDTLEPPKALVLLDCLPKELVDAEPPTPGVLVVLRFHPDEAGYVTAGEPIVDGPDYDIASEYVDELKAQLAEAGDEEGNEYQLQVTKVPPREDEDFESQWTRPGFLCRLRNAWDAFRGRRPWK